MNVVLGSCDLTKCAGCNALLAGATSVQVFWLGSRKPSHSCLLHHLIELKVGILGEKLLLGTGEASDEASFWDLLEKSFQKVRVSLVQHHYFIIN